MGGDTTNWQSSYFSGCMSPSCVPVHEEYSRINCTNSGGNRSRRLRKMLRNLVKDSKSCYGSSKSVKFQYDAVSYSQNFDDGCHKDEYALHVRQHLFRDFRCRVQN